MCVLGDLFVGGFVGVVASPTAEQAGDEVRWLWWGQRHKALHQRAR